MINHVAVFFERWANLRHPSGYHQIPVNHFSARTEAFAKFGGGFFKQCAIHVLENIAEVHAVERSVSFNGVFRKPLKQHYFVDLAFDDGVVLLM